MAEESKAPIVIDDLKKSFGKQVVLDGISFQVARGETLGVLGRSGTGKSVLLKLMIGLQRPDSGSVCIDDKDISDLDNKGLIEVRKKMGFLFQKAALYDSLSVGDNIAFPLGRHTKMSEGDQEERARDLLKSVGMKDDDLAKLPADISGGMQKRVGLARALALDPEILLCDEPTAGLDPITAADIGALIVDLKKQRNVTTVVVTHDLRGAKVFADRLLLLNEGKVVAEGGFEDLENNPDPFVSRFFQEAK
jgi:phospholipid/cholesterol/gamma-HCH transport system ATP-binding protein